MKQRYLLFRLLGFPVHLEPSYLLLVALYVLIGGLSASALSSTLVFIVAASISILWHELGHALMARRQGASGTSIVLHGMGGTTFFTPLGSLRRSLLVTAAGPLSGLALGLALWAGVAATRSLGLFEPLLVGQLLRDLIYVNIVWSVFNLLPMLPLDGGRLMQDLLLLHLPRRRAGELAQATSFLLAVGLGLFGLWHRWVFVTLICLFSAQLAWQQMGGLGPVKRLWANLRG